VIAALVVLRICLQFGLQHVGVMVLRKRKPEMPRPFRLWLYPLPPILALAGFKYIVVSRPNFARELILAALVAAVGTAVFVARQVQKAKGQQSDNEITSGEGVGT
jgi:amino acid transporter